MSHAPENTYNAFFYGTLLHPRVLKRVIGNDGNHLKISPALLKGYVRHKVLGADFPAIISADESHEFFRTVPNETDDCVRGSYVSGLTIQDILRLERFESGLYTKETVEVCLLLRDLVNLNDIELETLIDTNLNPGSGTTSQTVRALTFVWGKPHEDLLPQPWSFEDFVNTKLERWG